MNPALAAEIGGRIRDLRKTHGWSQIDLAERLKVNKSTVAYYETGERSPSYDVLIRMCDLFSVSSDYIIRGIDDTQYAVNSLPSEQAAAIRTILTALHDRET